MFNKRLNKFQEKFVDIVIFVSYCLIFISFFRLSSTAPQYLEGIDYYFRIYICLFLIWRFNPLRKIDTFTNLDRKIAFSAGLFILTTTALNDVLGAAKEKAEKIRQKLLSIQ
jgi:hypothetical protein